MYIINSKNNHERFKKIFSNSGVGIFIVDKDRNIIECNETFCKILGYSQDEIIGKSAEEIHINKDKYLHFADIAFNKVRQNQALYLDYEFKHKSGKKIWLRISGDPIASQDEVLWIIVDITKRIEAEKKLKESREKIKRLNKSLNEEVQNQLQIIRKQDEQLRYQQRLTQMGEILDMIAHQWRQPLAAITATSSYLYTSIMMDEFNKASFLEEIFRIENYSKYLSQTIDEFREFFKPTKEKQLTSLEELSSMSIYIVEALLQANGIKIYTDYKCNATFYAYKNEISQVILNIINNAGDAFIEREAENKFIKISTYTEENYLCLSIEDNAGGIDDSIMDKIFNLYFSTKENKNGSGIGLYISKIIIEEHCSGILEVQKTKDGSLFTIKLPK
ncbi:MAG: PAS domain S-box protein [Campylobacteraceae bacterium]|nr:PAS domain S-box protein [Campylobacteraceae bacterium]